MICWERFYLLIYFYQEATLQLSELSFLSPKLSWFWQNGSRSREILYLKEIHMKLSALGYFYTYWQRPDLALSKYSHLAMIYIFLLSNYFSINYFACSMNKGAEHIFNFSKFVLVCFQSDILVNKTTLQL